MNEDFKNKYHQNIDDYINGVNKSPLDDIFLKEMDEFSERMKLELTAIKALRVQVRCLLMKKKDIAEKIEKKYGRLFPKSDMAMAFRISLMANKNK